MAEKCIGHSKFSGLFVASAYGGVFKPAARQLKYNILKTLTTISGCFVLGCQFSVARIYCDEQKSIERISFVFGNNHWNY